MSEGLVEPLDGVVARYICIPVYAHLDNVFSSSRLGLNHLSTAAIFSAFISGLMSHMGEPIMAGIMALVTLFMSWLGWKQAERLGASRLGIIMGSTLDRIGETLIISGMVTSPLVTGESLRLIGVLSLAGSLTVSYTAVRSGREYKGLVWRGFSAYGATRDVRLTVIASSSILNVPSLGLAFLAVLTLTVVVKRLLDLLPLG